MLETIKLPVTEYHLWDSLLDESPQGTIFASPKWLDLFMKPYAVYGVFEEDRLMGGISGFVDGGGFSSGNCTLTPYSGIVIKPLPDAKPPRYESICQDICNSLISTLQNEYSKIVISNHWSFTDLRPFQWHGWKEFVKYTYVVDLVDLDETLKGMEKMTRYEAKKSADSLHMCSPTEFALMYAHTFQRKGLDQPVDSEFVIRLINEGWASAFKLGEAAAVVIKDNKRLYYILGASEEGHYTSALLWKIMQHQTRIEIDLVGCNVPEIALFKRGFGGKLIHYTGATYEV